ncbi:MAG: tetratricopeptide repeat protein [Bdellovibrionales bacterium]|nr:tetratricopeptide repeat protein [Bdellovibrionales bacterium]
MRKNRRGFLPLLISITFLGCSFNTDQVYFDRAQKAQSEEKYDVAIQEYKRVIEVDPGSPKALEAAEKAAFVARTFTEDFTSLIHFLKIILLRSPNEKVRVSAQKEIADIYFINLNNYSRAIEEYSRLLPLISDEPEKIETQLRIAKAYYFLGQFQQALFEIESTSKLKSTEKQKFETLLLKANILTGQKDYDDAAAIFLKMISEFPQMAKAEKVRVNLAVCYEELKKFDLAIEELVAYGKETPVEKDFVELKVERLKRIKELQPGAGGMRK